MALDSELSLSENNTLLSRLKGWLYHTAGVDRAVAYSVIGKVWQILAGLVNIILIAKFTTRSEQGYLYTFQSLLAFQILFDLSLSSVLGQFAAHEMADLQWQPDGTVQGEITAKSRLASILRISFRWYSIAAVLMLLFLTTGGYIFFTVKEVLQNPVDWRLPWVLLCVPTSILIIFTPILGIIEGCGKVTEVAGFRMLQESICAFIFWGALLAGLKLFALPIFFFSRVVTQLFYFFGKRREFLFDLMRTSLYQKVCFKTEIWPFQWRYLICAVASLLSSFLTVPIVFAAQGPVVSGQIGMTFSITNALLSVSMAWINTKVPLFCNLVALKKYDELDRTFHKVSRQSFAVIVSLATAVIFLIFSINSFIPSFAVRLADPASAALLVLSIVVAFPNIAGSSYLRAHKREVTSWANLTTALITLGFIYLASRYPGLLYIGIVQLISSGFLALWVYLLFRRYKKEWHA